MELINDKTISVAWVGYVALHFNHSSLQTKRLTITKKLSPLIGMMIVHITIDVQQHILSRLLN